jgi:hypothetical protein
MKVKTRSHDNEICFFFLSKLCNINFENTIIIYLLLVCLTVNCSVDDVVEVDGMHC